MEWFHSQFVDAKIVIPVIINVIPKNWFKLIDSLRKKVLKKRVNTIEPAWITGYTIPIRTDDIMLNHHVIDKIVANAPQKI